MVRATQQTGRPRLATVSTRMLMILAFLTGMLILVAFAVQVILYLT